MTVGPGAVGGPGQEGVAHRPVVPFAAGRAPCADALLPDAQEGADLALDAAVDLLKGQRGIVQKYWSDATAQTEDFVNEGVVAAPSWPYQVNLLQAEDEPIESVIPDEGTTGWSDTWMMYSEAKHPNCMLMWMDHMMSP